MLVFYSCCTYTTVNTGPFKELQSEQIDSEVGDMLRTLHKLARQLGDSPGPRSVTDRTKVKIDKFKVHLPLLSVLCNPGIGPRHWSLASRICGLFNCLLIFCN